MLSVAYVIGFLGMIVLPILLAFWLARKFKLSWKLLLAGALTFIASQVLHIPLVYGLTAAFKSGALPAVPQAWTLVFNAVLLGLLAGIFEETARYILFRFVLNKAHSWEEGVVVGVGHGGVEAVLLGISAAAGFFSMLVYRSADLSTLPGIPPEQLDLLRQQVMAYWSNPAYLPLLAIVERASAISLHIALSVMVLYSIVQHKPTWFWVALLWHAFVDAMAVLLVSAVSPVAVEGVLVVLALISLGILFALRPRFVQPGPDRSIPPAV